MVKRESVRFSHVIISDWLQVTGVIVHISRYTHTNQPLKEQDIIRYYISAYVIPPRSYLRYERHEDEVTIFRTV
jgi:hypothetical protein